MTNGPSSSRDIFYKVLVATGKIAPPSGRGCGVASVNNGSAAGTVALCKEGEQPDVTNTFSLAAGQANVKDRFPSDQLQNVVITGSGIQVEVWVEVPQKEVGTES